MRILINDMKSLLTIYKSFDSPLLGYADVIYDKPCKEMFNLGYADVIYDKPCKETFKGKLEAF